MFNFTVVLFCIECLNGIKWVGMYGCSILSTLRHIVPIWVWVCILRLFSRASQVASFPYSLANLFHIRAIWIHEKAQSTAFTPANVNCLRQSKQIYISSSLVINVKYKSSMIHPSQMPRQQKVKKNPQCIPPQKQIICLNLQLNVMIFICSENIWPTAGIWFTWHMYLIKDCNSIPVSLFYLFYILIPDFMSDWSNAMYFLFLVDNQLWFPSHTN